MKYEQSDKKELFLILKKKASTLLRNQEIYKEIIKPYSGEIKKTVIVKLDLNHIRLYWLDQDDKILGNTSSLKKDFCLTGLLIGKKKIIEKNEIEFKGQHGYHGGGRKFKRNDEKTVYKTLSISVLPEQYNQIKKIAKNENLSVSKLFLKKLNMI